MSQDEFNVWLETQNKNKLGDMYDEYLNLMEDIQDSYGEEVLPYQEWLKTHYENQKETVQ